jgi:ubiquinone/menaquinone biosynthesis C-methylase UbiE
MVQSAWHSTLTPAERYERYLAQGLLGDWTAALVALGNPQLGDRVLDVACGTGIVARAVAPYVGASGLVTGLDRLADRLAYARVLAAGLPIEWREADACAIPFPEAAFTLVLCQQGLNHIADKVAAVREMHRVLVPGGRLALTVWSTIEHLPAFAAWVSALEVHPHLAKTLAEQRAVMSFAATRLRDLLIDAGFMEVAVRRDVRMGRCASSAELVQQHVGLLMVADGERLIDTLDEAAREEVLAMARRRLQAYEDLDGLAVPMEAWVATAQKAG